MYKSILVVACAVCTLPVAHAQVMQRELGDFELKFANAPTRSMAQGLVRPGQANSAQGGVDASHASGWYVGSWTSNLEQEKPLEIDTYAGFKHPLGDGGLGYELGTLRYTRPEQPDFDSQALYGGLSVFGSRLGAAYSSQGGRSSATLFTDLGLEPDLGFDVSFKYSTYNLAEPVSLSGGGSVSGFGDWSVNLSRPWLGLDLNFSYSGSSLTGSDCSAYSGHNTYCDTAVMFKASKPLF
ncbi:TorF family putative porin [Pseudomonas nitroreducens]|uniref:TorF family putative porin n=1 Tax=Pseudomonas nitroreducens TaxID=46680 RepID=UPI00351CCE93